MLRKIFVPFFCWIALAAAIPAAETDLRFLRGLSERRLFESADVFCDRVFRRDDVLPDEKYELASEQVRTLTRRMLLEEPRKRLEIRDRLADLEKRFPDGPDEFSDPKLSLARITLGLQRAMSLAEQGDWRRLEAEVAPDAQREDGFRRARQGLYDAIDALKGCKERLDAFSQHIARNADRTLERKIGALAASIRFQWGLAQMSLARSFEPGEDRNFALRAAAEILEETASLGIQVAPVSQSRIELASCYRLLGDTAKCGEILVRLKDHSLSGPLRLQAEAELIRYRIARGETDDPDGDIARKRPDSNRYPDYDLARLQWHLVRDHRIREAAGGGPDETAKQAIALSTEGIVRLVREIERQSGPYWGRRARMILGALSGKETETGAPVDPEIMKLLAEDQYQRGHYSEAVRLFDQAARLAERRGDSHRAFDDARASVAVLGLVQERLERDSVVSEEEKKAYFAQLIDALRTTAIRFARQENASELHLKGVDLAASAVLREEMSLDDYIGLLTEHTDHWPDSVKVPPLLLRAALLLEQRGRTNDARAVLQKIPNRTPQGLEAVEAIRRCYENEAGTDDLEAAARFEGRLVRDDTPWNEADARSALYAAEFYLRAFASRTGQDGTPKPEIARIPKATERLLRQILRRHPDLEPVWKARTLAMLVSALSDDHREKEASEVLQTLNDELLEKLSPRERRSFQRLQAKLLAETGKVQQAVDLLVDLLKQSPEDLSIRELLAEILGRQESVPVREKALSLWLGVVQAARKDSETWWNAREHILELQQKLGRDEEAKKDFRRLRLLYPHLGGAARKTRLENRFGP